MHLLVWMLSQTLIFGTGRLRLPGRVSRLLEAKTAEGNDIYGHVVKYSNIPVITCFDDLNDCIHYFRLNLNKPFHVIDEVKWTANVHDDAKQVIFCEMRDWYFERFNQTLLADFVCPLDDRMWLESMHLDLF